MSNAGNAKTLAQHFTPAAVAQLVWDAVRTLAGKELGTGARVVDPAAGEGALLAVVGRACQTTGIEIDEGLAERGRSQADRFYTGDGLLGTFPEVEDESFDCVLANPPFGKLGPMLSLFGTDGPCRLARRFGLLDGQKQVRAFPVELLFVERALQLTRPAGWMALILPEGFFANARRQGVRDWLLARAEVRAVVALPGAFNKVQTALVVLQRSKPQTRAAARLIAPVEKRPSVEQYAQRTQLLLGASARRGPEASLLSVGQRALRTQRWDPRFWQGRAAVRRLAGRLPLVPLGEYICHLTYGPIVTGSRPQHVEAGVPVIRQGDIAETGLDECALLCVVPAGAHDPPRSRVCPGDLLLSRSGAGSLGRNRPSGISGEWAGQCGLFCRFDPLGGAQSVLRLVFFQNAAGTRADRRLRQRSGHAEYQLWRNSRLADCGLALGLSGCSRKALPGASVAAALPPRACGHSRPRPSGASRAIVGDLEDYLQTRRQ